MGKREEIADHKWEMQFFELKKFKKKYGHCDVPQNNSNYPKLARWCGEQRRIKKFHPLKLNPVRAGKLNELGFSWGLRDKWFEKNFSKLKTYLLKNGHCYVFRTQDKNLNKWCTHLRENKKNNLETLTVERIKLLDSFGFDWNPDVYFYENIHFEQRLAELKDFISKHGRYPLRDDKKYPFLSTWVERQRHDLRYKILSNERIMKLNAFGFTWNPRKENWEKHFEELKIFKAKFGHCNILQSKLNENYYALAHWCLRQRKSYNEKNKSLTGKQIKKLNNLGFNWVHPFKPGEIVRSRTSDETLLNELKRLNKKFGRTPTLRDLKQFSKYKKGQYSLRFGSFGNAIAKAGLMDKNEGFWLTNYDALTLFINTYHRLPLRNEPNYEFLNLWVTNQRQLKKRGQLSDNRIKLLNDIKFQWSINDSRWDINFEKLKAYKKEFGHCNVLESGNTEKLGAWVGIQRRRKSRLSIQRIEKLNSIGFSWKSSHKSK